MAPTRLLYISDDEGLSLADLDAAPGAERRCLLDPAQGGLAAAWPVPCPSGDAALVSAVGRDALGASRLELLHVSLNGEAPPRLLFRNDPESAEFIAPGVAHYACWAPGGRLAALVGRGGGSLRLSLIAADGRLPARTLIDGAPLFIAWAPDGRALAVHAGGDLLLFDTREAEPQRILQDQARFRTPAWDEAGEALFYVAPGAAGRDLLWRSRRDGKGREIVTEVEGATALLASPRGDRLALLTLAEGGLGGHNLRLLDPADGATRLLERGPLQAALWAPDGDSIFSFIPAGLEPDSALHRFDLASGRRTQLARFRPSPAYSIYLAFFEQYARSHPLLSADGRWILLAGTVAGNGADSRRPPGPQWGCYAFSTDGSAPPRRIASGEIGVFAPPAGKPRAPGKAG